MSMLDELAQYIHDQGIAILGTNLFKGYLPEAPDNAMSILDTGGTAPDLDLAIHNPTFQIFIRSTTYNAGRTLLDSIRNAFHQQENVQLVPNGTYFYYIFALSEGGHIGRNDSGFDEFSINFRAKTRS